MKRIVRVDENIPLFAVYDTIQNRFDSYCDTVAWKFAEDLRRDCNADISVAVRMGLDTTNLGVRRDHIVALATEAGYGDAPLTPRLTTYEIGLLRNFADGEIELEGIDQVTPATVARRIIKLCVELEQYRQTSAMRGE